VNEYEYKEYKEKKDTKGEGDEIKVDKSEILEILEKVTLMKTELDMLEKKLQQLVIKDY
jgi:hypothetical protein